MWRFAEVFAIDRDGHVRAGVNLDAGKAVGVQPGVAQVFAHQQSRQHHHRTGATEAAGDQQIELAIVDAGMRHRRDAAAETRRVQCRCEQGGTGSQWLALAVHGEVPVPQEHQFFSVASR